MITANEALVKTNKVLKPVAGDTPYIDEEVVNWLNQRVTMRANNGRHHAHIVSQECEDIMNRYGIDVETLRTYLECFGYDTYYNSKKNSIVATWDFN